MPLDVFVREVSPKISQCELTCIEREPIDFQRVVRQHEAYVAVFDALLSEVNASSSTPLRVHKLPALAEFADSMFVEDVALMFRGGAVVFTRPGAESRRGEVAYMESAARDILSSSLWKFFTIEAPGIMDGGDILVVGRHVFVGESTRTNLSGFQQLSHFLTPFGYTVHQVRVRGCLHLKSAASMVTDSIVLANTSWIDPTLFTDIGFEVIATDISEPHSANVLSFVVEKNEAAPSADADERTTAAKATTRATTTRIVVVPAAFPKLIERLEQRFAEKTKDCCTTRVVVLEVDEIAKAEGALTCCSLLAYS